MKLVNPKAPGAKFALPGNKIVEADANGIIEMPDQDIANALLRSGYMKVEDFAKVQAQQKTAPKPEVSRIASESIKAKEEMIAAQKAKESAAQAKPTTAPAQAEPVKVEAVAEEEPLIEEVEETAEEAGEDKPKRGWKRGK